MGAKDSKPSFISYEDAVKRVPDSELRRIREAFKRCAGANGTALSLEAFVREVLSDGVPYEVAEWLYQACGGTKRGIGFRDLLCGLVVLTKGTIDEKIKFLWTLYVNYQNENGMYLYKRDFSMALHFENNSLPVTEAHKTAEILTSLFGLSDKVTYEQFRSWLLIHKHATVLSKWLLSDRFHQPQDLETPTFYQSLAGVTHLEERDIIELEKCFWSLRSHAPPGQLDFDSMKSLLCPPLPRAAVEGTFLAFDENRDGHIDFKELCCGLSAACRGPTTERLKFCFKIFDVDRDGVLNRKELVDMVGILCTVANEAIKNSSRSSTPSESSTSDHGTEKLFDPEVVLLNLRDKLAQQPMFILGPTGTDATADGETLAQTRDEQMQPTESEGIIPSSTALPLEDFLIWAVESADGLVTPFLELLFEVCHIVLGLRPQGPNQEGDIVLGWLRREEARGYQVGQFWYLINTEWWTQWMWHVRHQILDHSADSDTHNSTESMGSLLWRADTASLGSASASSSGVSSQTAHKHVGVIDNTTLLHPNTLKVPTLTGEGGHLRRDVTLVQHRDFELVPAGVWRALALWYGATTPLPRQVIRPANSDVELELYPLHLKLLRHVQTQNRLSAVAAVGSAGASLYSSVPSPPDRQLAYTAAFSRLATVKQVSESLCQALCLAREDMRLWSIGSNNLLLDDDRPTLQELGFDDRTRLLVEVRNADLTWPEEIGALSMLGGGRATERRDTLIAPNLPGATGLHNLGNTCYMNAALQAVWNTGPLTRYFNSSMHLYEINVNNPLGTRGALARRYGELCKEVWSCSARSVAPLKVRWCVTRHARHLAGGQQHDAQELLAWLLDALHEDLNRATSVHVPHDDSNGRPDQEVASEAWSAHLARNQSIITDLFYGQLKSKVQCDACGKDSTRFDAFNMLSLPLPMECNTRAEVRVILLDGSVPVKYGARVNSDGTYRDLKVKLSQLCGLAPQLMLLVELSGSTIGKYLDDNAKISPQTACDLYGYELPHTHVTSGDDSATQCCEDGTTEEQADGGASGGWAEVSVPRRSHSSLCMPALFCFKRSRSEILMSASPPSFTQPAAAGAVFRSSTLPRDLSNLNRLENGSSSPTLSSKSLNHRSSGRSYLSPRDNGLGRVTYLVAQHRKQCRSDAYFLPSQRSAPALFGVPLLVPMRDGMCGRDIYDAVWTQVARLLTPRPRQDHYNHATDCDDSLGYTFPFTLRLVDSHGACAMCPWPAFCRGIAIATDMEPIVHNTTGNSSSNSYRRASSNATRSSNELRPNTPDCNSPIVRNKIQRQNSARHTEHAECDHLGECSSRLDFALLRQIHRRGSVFLAIDWDPTALHLQYQSTREKAWTEHESVSACVAEASRPVDLASCLRAFTSEERLEQPYHCASCRTAQPATKKLQLWRAPPILIIHLKRFQCVNNKWIKSQKVVNFPFSEFDPTPFLASVPQETILRHMELKQRPRNSLFIDEAISESDSEDEETPSTEAQAPKEHKPKPKVERRRNSIPRRQRLESSSLVTAPVTDDNLIDYHKHHLLKDQDPFDLKYRLYAVVSHSGQLHGGHYVCYARNPSGAWLCYNDSSCRELPDPSPIDPHSAYLLFYERQGLDYEAYIPDTTGREPIIRDIDSVDPDENDLRKMCSIA